MKLKLFLTFDHELPLGKLKTSYQEALFEPTEKVMVLAEAMDVKVNLFTDILCGFRFRGWDYDHFYLPYTQQLKDALLRGHDVQLHIHPHWLTSTYSNEQFHASAEFSLSNFINNNQFKGIEGVVSMAAKTLTDICQAAKPDYQCIAYRAGGYNLQPATAQIFDVLYKAGIRYDSSIARGYYFKSGISEVDFSKLPDQGNWIIDPNDLSKAGSQPGVTEIPIITIPKSPFEVPTAFKMKKTAHRAPVSHGQVIHENGEKSLKSKLRAMFCHRMVSFDNYTLSSDYLLKALDYNIRKYGKTDLLLLSMIAHPKSMGDYSFQMMKEFIEKVRSKYPDAEFSTFNQLHQANHD